MSAPSPTADLDRRAWKAGIVDSIVGLAIAFLVWPFPIMRATLGGWRHVAVLMVWIIVVQFAYASISLLLRGRTLGWYAYGLACRPAASPPEASDKQAGLSRAQIVTWSLGWAVAGLAGVLITRLTNPRLGVPARLSGVHLIGQEVG